MPVSLRNSESLNNFKSLINKHYFNALTNSYDPNQFNTWKSMSEMLLFP